jgi:hypothetical protein
MYIPSITVASVLLFCIHLQYCSKFRHVLWSRDSAVGITMSYGMEGPDSILGSAMFFSLLHSIQTETETHPASYSMGTGGSFPGGKAAGA